jgi:DNA-binding CsgD family transcriptional regulator
MESVNVGAAAMKLTYVILGHKTDRLLDIFTQLRLEIGVNHIAYVRLSHKKSIEGAILTSGVVTYSRQWQIRYILKRYFLIDPVVRYGSTASDPFDWEDIGNGNPVTREFFADAARNHVGNNGLSIPVRNRKKSYAIVSFTNDMPRPDWELFKHSNMDKLKHLSALIDSAAMTGLKLEDELDVNLSLREEECLIWAARGKTYEDIADITNLSYYSVRSHLDIARHKLHGTNLTHAVAIAIASGVISPSALRGIV